MPATAELTAQLAAEPTVSVTSAVTGDDANDPSSTTPEYQRMKPRWEKCRDCFTGTEAIRAGRTKYLPQHSAESDSRYAVRLVLAAFYNGYARTVLASVGMLLETGVTLGDDMPEELTALAENIDAAGTHLNVFTRKLATSGIVDGYAGILTEHSRPDPAKLDLSKASAAAAIAIANNKPLDAVDEKLLGLRPYFLLFKTDDVIKAVYEPVDGVKTLTLLSLREIVRRREGRFGLKTLTQYRVYTNDRGVISYELWRAPELGGQSTRVEGPTRITNQVEIPWSPFPAGEEIATGEYKPPLLDLADLNIEYHNSKTNHLSLQSLAYVPTPVRIGAQKDPTTGKYPELVLGPGNTIEAPVQEGVAQPVYWLSPPVDVLDAGDRTMAQQLAGMASLGAAFLSAETRAAETAEGKRIDSSASRATLGSVGISLKDCLESAFGFAASFRKLKGGSVSLNENFTGEGIDTVLLGVLLEAYAKDAITLEEFRYFAHTGQLPEDFDPAKTEALLAQADARRELLRLEAAKGGGAGSGGAGGST